MEDDLKALAAMLRAEKGIFVRYLEKLNAQQAALIDNNLDAVRSSVEEISGLAREAANLENDRRAIIARLSAKLGIAPDDITVSKLLEKFKGPGLDELERLRCVILKIHRKVKAQKERNEMLIEQSMSVIRQTLDNISEPGDPGAAFSNPRTTRKGTAKSSALLARPI